MSCQSRTITAREDFKNIFIKKSNITQTPLIEILTISTPETASLKIFLCNKIHKLSEI